MATEIKTPYQELTEIANANGGNFTEIKDEGKIIRVGSYSGVGIIPAFVEVSIYSGEIDSNSPKSSYIITPDSKGHVLGGLDREAVAGVIANRVTEACRRSQASESA